MKTVLENIKASEVPKAWRRDTRFTSQDDATVCITIEFEDAPATRQIDQQKHQPLSEAEIAVKVAKIEKLTADFRANHRLIPEDELYDDNGAPK